MTKEVKTTQKETKNNQKETKYFGNVYTVKAVFDQEKNEYFAEVDRAQYRADLKNVKDPAKFTAQVEAYISVAHIEELKEKISGTKGLEEKLKGDGLTRETRAKYETDLAKAKCELAKWEEIYKRGARKEEDQTAKIVACALDSTCAKRYKDALEAFADMASACRKFWDAHPEYAEAGTKTKEQKEAFQALKKDFETALAKMAVEESDTYSRYLPRYNSGDVTKCIAYTYKGKDVSKAKEEVGDKGEVKRTGSGEVGDKWRSAKEMNGYFAKILLEKWQKG